MRPRTKSNSVEDPTTPLDATLDPKVLDTIGRALKARYDDCVRAPLPEKILDLLARLKRGEEAEEGQEKPRVSASFRDGLLAETLNLRVFALSLSGSVSMADDLVQETLLRAWSKSDKFQPGTNLHAWLFTILRNIYYSNYRKRAHELQDSDGVYAQRLLVLGDQESHLDLEDFRKALAGLPAEQREVLILVGANGLSYQQAAMICDVEIGTIKSRLSRARSKLVEILQLDEIAELRAQRKKTEQEE